ncbi:hypothetical protein [Tsuneonella amylolytica]|uniref:hypothetical protein n=1 Tax=Tsuneonella amylolytica TaxID=2338327 RepID=UPI000EAA0AE3|nr:hypothetical protein [Tsuneonella amylolytica]
MPKFRAAASRLTLAFALATGGAVAMTAVATPAMAQKKEAKAPKANYSKPFVAVYQPIAKVLTDNGDAAPLKAQLPALQAAASTPDDKFAAGQITYSVGAKTDDITLQRQGLDWMLDSGKMEGADYAKNLYAAASLAYNAEDWAKAQARAQQAIDAGYTGDAELLLAETYFGQNQTTQGLDYIDKAIAKKVAAGQPVPEAWLKRALARSYEANLEPQSFKYAGMYAQYYPSATSWGDAIAIQRNLREYGDQELLDLMRLAQRTKSLRNERDYIDYLSASDARRLPGETQRIIDAGIAAGLLKQNDTLVNEARTIAAGRVKADMADLPTLQANATASGGTATAAMAAGDAYLGYQQSAKAEEMYKLALSRPGVDTARVLTRLGIAQLDQGKYAEADANFLKVQGARQAIAQLWSIYGKQAAAPAAPAAQ